MTTTVQTQSGAKANLTFNAFYNEDSTTKAFLHNLVLKNPWEWAMLRQVFEGKDGSVITIVDRNIETPFHCMLVALFCKQLMEELGTRAEKILLMVTPIKKEQPGRLNTVNSPFDTTANRNKYLCECFRKITGIEIFIITKRNPIGCRDLKITIDGYTLYVRSEGGIARGWQPVNKYLSELPAKELLDLHQTDLPCSNIYVHGHSRNGVFMSMELQSNMKN